MTVRVCTQLAQTVVELVAERSGPAQQGLLITGEAHLAVSSRCACTCEPRVQARESVTRRRQVSSSGSRQRLPAHNRSESHFRPPPQSRSGQQKGRPTGRPHWKSMCVRYLPNAPSGEGTTLREDGRTTRHTQCGCCGDLDVSAVDPGHSGHSRSSTGLGDNGTQPYVEVQARVAYRCRASRAPPYGSGWRSRSRSSVTRCVTTCSPNTSPSQAVDASVSPAGHRRTVPDGRRLDRPSITGGWLAGRPVDDQRQLGHDARSAARRATDAQRSGGGLGPIAEAEQARSP